MFDWQRISLKMLLELIRRLQQYAEARQALEAKQRELQAAQAALGAYQSNLGGTA